MYIRLRVKYPLLLSDCNETWTCPTYLRKILKYQISRKSVIPRGQTDGRTDGHDESNSRFSQFCERP